MTTFINTLWHRFATKSESNPIYLSQDEIQKVRMGQMTTLKTPVLSSVRYANDKKFENYQLKRLIALNEWLISYAKTTKHIVLRSKHLIHDVRANGLRVLVKYEPGNDQTKKRIQFEHQLKNRFGSNVTVVEDNENFRDTYDSDVTVLLLNFAEPPDTAAALFMLLFSLAVLCISAVLLAIFDPDTWSHVIDFLQTLGFYILMPVTYIVSWIPNVF
jgi:hypothetical protein